MAITRLDFLKELRDYRLAQYRPPMFRTVFGPTMLGKVDDVVQTIEMYEVTPSGEIKFISGDQINGLPVTTFDGALATAKAVTGALAFMYSNEQLARYDRNKINWREVAGRANFQIVEQYLDKTAFLGDTVRGLGGLASSSAVSLVTLGTKAATGVAWTSATHEEMVQDLIAMSVAVENNSYQYFQGTDICLPSAAYDKGAASVHTYSGKNVFQAAQERRPEIKNIFKVAHLTGAGSGSANRGVCFCKSAEVATFNERAFREEKIQEVALGGIVPETFRTTGTIIESTQGIVYADGF